MKIITGHVVEAFDDIMDQLKHRGIDAVEYPIGDACGVHFAIVAVKTFADVAKGIKVMDRDECMTIVID